MWCKYVLDGLVRGLGGERSFFSRRSPTWANDGGPGTGRIARGSTGKKAIERTELTEGQRRRTGALDGPEPPEAIIKGCIRPQASSAPQMQQDQTEGMGMEVAVLWTMVESGRRKFAGSQGSRKGSAGPWGCFGGCAAAAGGGPQASGHLSASSSRCALCSVHCRTTSSLRHCAWRDEESSSKLDIASPTTSDRAFRAGELRGCSLGTIGSTAPKSAAGHPGA